MDKVLLIALKFELHGHPNFRYQTETWKSNQSLQ